ncbi:MAG: PhnB protein [Mucilaginibacter sp.]|nr:PhnB protein [Mucilaginibacter sp.]
MEKLNVPEGYNQVMPYLIIENAAAFMEFTQKVFDAKETHKTMRTEELIMHAGIRIGESVIMLADATDQYKKQPAGLFVYVDDCDAIYKKALDNGATTAMEPSDQSYGRSAGIKDNFGNTWWITSAS